MVRIVVLLSLLFALDVRAQDRPGPTIALGGDVLYDGPLAFQLRRRGRRVGREQAYREVFADLTPALSGADLAIVNLEVPISPRYRDRDPVDGASPVFRAPEDFVDALRDSGVDALTVANNHAYDQGIAGLRNTLAAIETRDLVAIGAGEDARGAARAVIVPARNARIAIAAWTEGLNNRPEWREGTTPCVSLLSDDSVAESLRAARGSADFVIASFHWTQEGDVDPRWLMRVVARSAAEAGADLVYGHGTHVPGRTEMIVTSDGRRVPVLYSLGNLLAAMEEPAGTLEAREVGVRDAPIALISTRWEGERLVAAEVSMRNHYIARPDEAPEERAGIFRPVSIDNALAQLATAQCAECPRRMVLYRRRDALLRNAMRAINTPPVRQEPIRQEPVRVAAVRPPSTRVPEERPPPRSVMARIADDDPRLAPLLRGVTVTVEFGPGSVVERTVDGALITRVAALLREDPSLRVETVARGELAVLRARRVNGLIAIRGPSRSRFSARSAPGESGVVLRLYR